MSRTLWRRRANTVLQQIRGAHAAVEAHVERAVRVESDEEALREIARARQLTLLALVWLEQQAECVGCTEYGLPIYTDYAMFGDHR